MDIPNLGGLERPKDERDFDLDRILGSIAAPAQPSSYVPSIQEWIQRNWQQQQPACGPHGGYHLKNILDFFMANSTATKGWGRKTPRYGWTKLKDPKSPVYDGYPLDAGTDMRSIFKLLQNVGADDFEPLENDASLSLPDYANPAAITPEMDQNAAGSKILSYAFGKTDYDSLCQQIWQAKAVLLLIKCDEGFWHTTEPTFTNPKWGHFVCAYGYDESGIWVIDSADPDDVNAFKHIAKQYITPRFIIEAGTAIDMPVEQVRQIVNVSTNIVQQVSVAPIAPAQKLGFLAKLSLILTSLRSLIFPKVGSTSITMTPKPWYQSKTLWFNGVTILVTIAGLFGYTPDQQVVVATGAFLTALSPVLNVVLRLVTKQPIGSPTNS